MIDPVKLIMDKAHDAQGDIVNEEVAHLKEVVGTPYPPASAPDTPPHRREGDLQDGIGGVTEMSSETTIESTIYSGSDKPRKIASVEFGTSRMRQRPYMRPSIEDMKEHFLARLAAKMKSQ